MRRSIIGYADQNSEKVRLNPNPIALIPDIEEPEALPALAKSAARMKTGDSSTTNSKEII